jgi:hypothetical protein
MDASMNISYTEFSNHTLITISDIHNDSNKEAPKKRKNKSFFSNGGINYIVWLKFK